MSLQSQIGSWHRSTFGERDIDKRLIAKFKEESAEFLEDPCQEEAADCLIVLMAYADRMGWDLMAASWLKFAEVRSRGAGQIDRDRIRGIE